ncbi:glycosyltransferase [Pyruvatibacter mobilis]|uniref:glycosyltransferase n=1 Tax=Pyruvatibacter mobilis TaxID=1712261 RepID=UPI003BB18446
MNIEDLKTAISITPVPGGQDARADRFVRYFEARGIKTVAFCGEGLFQEGATKKWTKVERGKFGFSDRIKSKLENGYIGPFILYLLWLIKIFTLNVRLAVRLFGCQRADIIVLHECSRFPAVWFILVARGGVFHYDAHDFYSGIEPSDLVSDFQRVWIYRTNRLLERWLLRRADVFTSVSDGIARMYDETFGHRPETVRNVADGASAEGTSVRLRDALKLRPEELLLCVIGNCKPGMDFGGVLRALRELQPGAHLVLAGGGHESTKRLARDLRVDQRVHDLGFVPTRELVSVVSQCDAACLVYVDRSDNYRYALPNGLFQSLAAKLPIIYLDLPEIHQLLDGFGIGIRLAANDTRNWIRAIHKVRHDHGFVADQKTKLEIASSELVWQVECHRLERAILNGLASRRKV